MAFNTQFEFFVHVWARYNHMHNHNESYTHAHQQPLSYHSAKQSNGKRINTSDAVEHALSKGTATEIGNIKIITAASFITTKT